MTEKLKKLFGGLEISWKGLIVFAVSSGVYTGIMAMLPPVQDTSFHDIAMSFEWWVLFGILIIINSRSAKEAALKCFVFFLISQPLVYLVQVPFSPDGFGLFRYYPAWFQWTLLTFPMAFIGHYMKKDKWWGLLILGPMLVFLGFHYENFFGEAVHFFPQHLLSAIFCAATMVIYPLFIFKDKRIRIAGLILSLVILIGASVYGALNSRSHTYNTQLLSSGGSICTVEYDDSYKVYLEDPSFGEVHIGYEEGIESYMVCAAFEKTGDTVIVLEAPDGTKYPFDLHVERDTYTVTPQNP